MFLELVFLGEDSAMWTCRKCHERHEDSFEVCWNCGTTQGGVEDPTFSRAEDQPARNAEAITETPPRPRPTQSTPHTERPAARSIEQLIFVGLNGYALALDRDTGAIVWSNEKMHAGYVTLLLDGDRLIVSTNGYMYCLDPLTGRIRWHNPLSGYGLGTPTCVVSVRGGNAAIRIQQAADDIARTSNG
jgi:hypothetical protein